MGQTSLHGFAGMVFEFPRPTRTAFYMKDTPMPLSIAWFGADGRFVGADNMAPCGAGPCPTYSAGVPYKYALEVPQGDLAGLGIGAGSVLTVGGSCGA